MDFYFNLMGFVDRLPNMGVGMLVIIAYNLWKCQVLCSLKTHKISSVLVLSSLTVISVHSAQCAREGNFRGGVYAEQAAW